MGNGSVYDNAYFEVGYVRVFSQTGTNTVLSSTAGLSSTASPGSSPKPSSASSTPSTSNHSGVGLPYGDVWMSATVVLLVGLISSTLFLTY